MGEYSLVNEARPEYCRKFRCLDLTKEYGRSRSTVTDAEDGEKMEEY